MPADAGGMEAHSARHREPGRLAGALAGRGEEALCAAEVPCRWRTWNRQSHHKMCCTP